MLTFLVYLIIKYVCSFKLLAGVVKLVDTLGLGPSKRKLVEVQVLSPAPEVTCSELRIWSDFAEAKIAL